MDGIGDAASIRGAYMAKHVRCLVGKVLERLCHVIYWAFSHTHTDVNAHYFSCQHASLDIDLGVPKLGPDDSFFEGAAFQHLRICKHIDLAIGSTLDQQRLAQDFGDTLPIEPSVLARALYCPELQWLGSDA
ncbi:hypothetical protein V8E36_003058 [Tilletia maclaganii]